jgi:probable HAF family extracellular repeat protein
MGTLGGDNAVAEAINDAGEIVGFSGHQGNQAVLAFLWKQGVMTSLGTVDGDPCSAAHSINAKGQVVGESSPSCFGIDSNLPGVHGFLWENGGPMVDLNTLLPPGSGIDLATGVSINDRGEINGEGVLPNGDIHAFLLIPCDEDHADIEGCDYSLVGESAEAEAESDHSVHSPVAPENCDMPGGLRDRLRTPLRGWHNSNLPKP